MAMTSIPRLGCLLVVATSISQPVAAQEADGGFYGRIFGGVSSLSDTDLDGAANASIGFDTGQVYGAAIGYDYAGSPFRSEIEFAYRTADADESDGIKGDFASTTLALNGYYDFATLSSGRLTPYVGLGLAYVTEIDFDLTGGGATGEYNDRDVFGYQVMAGVDYALSDRWSINGELRYFDAGSQTLRGPGGSLSSDYDTLEFIAGVTFRY